MLGPAPTPVKALVFVLNVAAFLLYKFDKQRAIEGGRRIPEKWLFAITLSGGMMGADLARRLFRHKTLKPSFSICIFLALMIQLLALCAVEDLGDAQPAQPTTQQIAPRADTAPSHVSHHRAHAHQSNAHAASAVE
jgi:uncharacterized membrane protein YsdA (DUF1294 family)